LQDSFISIEEKMNSNFIIKRLKLKGGNVMIPRIAKILYATDLSVNSAYAFRYALNTAEKHDAQIDLIHVFEPQRIFGELILVEDKIKKSQREAKPAAMKKIKARLGIVVKRELKDKPSMIDRISSIEVAEGDPTVEILKKITELKSDILIMGTNSKGYIAHTFLGDVAGKILQRIRIPVFIIPIPEETDIAFHND
jgi:nucleotide-binding universal stress UspA family protein